MVVTSIYDFELVKRLRTSYLVRIFFNRKETQVFYLSEKQYFKLLDCFRRKNYSKLKNIIIIIVIDNVKNRFVWSGIEYPDYSEREFLIKAFNAEWKDNYTLQIEEIVEQYVPQKIKKFDIKIIKELKK